MFPIYDEKAWKRLEATITAESVRSLASTFIDNFDPKSTAAYWAVQGSATNAGYPIFIAYDPPKNRLRMMFAYTAT
jgi:hypothetical protein